MSTCPSRRLHSRPWSTHNCECSRAPKKPHLPGDAGTSEKNRKQRKNALFPKPSSCLVTLPPARLAQDTQSTQEFQRLLPKPLGKRVDHERRPHLPKSHCSQQPEEARFTQCPSHSALPSIIRAAVSAITPRQTSTIHCQ